MRDAEAQYIEADHISEFAFVPSADNTALHELYRACIELLGSESKEDYGLLRPKPFTDLLENDDRVALGITKQLKPKLVKAHEKQKTVFELPRDFSQYGGL